MFMYRPALLLVFEPRPALRAALAARYELIGPVRHPEADPAVREAAARISAAVTVGSLGLSRSAIECLPGLRLICSYGAGMENIDRAAARERGVRIANGRGANASCVADMAMTLLLAAVARIIPADALVREGCWDRTPPTGWPLRPGLGGQRLGIFGMGDIGQRIAVRAAAFELAVGYCNRSPRTDVDYPYFGDLTELAAWADILVIAAPASPATRGRVDAEVLRALGPRGYLVNVGRGSVVEEGALIDALLQGGIAGAGLDVFVDEPHVPEALCALPNVVLSPHIAAVTDRAFAQLDHLLLANLSGFFKDGRLIAESFD